MSPIMLARVDGDSERPQAVIGTALEQLDQVRDSPGVEIGSSDKAAPVALLLTSQRDSPGQMLTNEAIGNRLVDAVVFGIILSGHARMASWLMGEEGATKERNRGWGNH